MTRRFAIAATLTCVVACGDGTTTDPCAASERGATMLEPEFVLIMPGEFEMGTVTTALPEHPQASVSLTRPFWVQTSEVTRAEFVRVLDEFDAIAVEQGVDPEDTAGLLEFGLDQKSFQRDWTPHYGVLVHAVAYANARSYLEGFEPCYDFRLCDLASFYQGVDADATRNNSCAWELTQYVDSSCEGYRLPTEAEWEFMARAGTTSDYLSGPTHHGMERWVGSRDGSLDVDLSSGAPEIGLFCPNDWGIYDAQGGVREWTNDSRGVRNSSVEQVTWFYGDDLVDPTGSAPPFHFDGSHAAYATLFIVANDPSEDGWMLLGTILKGSDPGDDWLFTHSSRSHFAGPPARAGIRLVRTEFSE